MYQNDLARHSTEKYSPSCTLCSYLVPLKTDMKWRGNLTGSNLGSTSKSDPTFPLSFLHKIVRLTSGRCWVGFPWCCCWSPVEPTLASFSRNCTRSRATMWWLKSLKGAVASQFMSATYITRITYKLGCWRIAALDLSLVKGVFNLWHNKKEKTV